MAERPRVALEEEQRNEENMPQAIVTEVPSTKWEARSIVRPARGVAPLLPEFGETRARPTWNAYRDLVGGFVARYPQPSGQ
ncbi:hypothetical protein FBY39_1163 [Microbacterium sp. SLBN-146]|nr:hypothetical protein FBY39_1163 [Microbacterium sp. SLBN-146]